MAARAELAANDNVNDDDNSDPNYQLSSESFWCRGIEAAVLAAQCTEATLFDKEVEVLGGKVGRALAELLHL